MRLLGAPILLTCIAHVPVLQAQDVTPATAQTHTWNSTSSLTREQIARANLSSAVAESVNVAARFEQTNWAGSSAAKDPFYTPPPNSTNLPCGSILAVEHFTNTSLYTLPPNTAMSRILFQSETANGSAVPASAYVLWPWMPRKDPETGGLAIIG
ncbi:Putative lipase, secreted, alpha/Beta hydrolase [Septoria linicola]|uniref:Lipase, secreted, alpha/Beta hydrolase n=1 Tax=Septoria linicola TaxID=215465 RepID=A0A9Q9AWV7_9PEZI|nr:putative lipase, secreted, alpha/Beta hydrolase [Septoria linicola]USW56914.1 Putative lipase, secreted, alpha/Beta hydrolase [Septoria linicola]